MPKTNKVVIIKTCSCWDNKYFDIGWYSNFTGLPKCALQNFLTGLSCGMFFLSGSVTMLWKNISTLCGIPTSWAPPNFLNWFLNMNTKNIFLDYSTRFGRSLCLLASSHLSPSHFLSGFSPVNALARFRIVLSSPRLTFSFNDMHPLSFSHLVCLFFFQEASRRSSNDLEETPTVLQVCSLDFHDKFYKQCYDYNIFYGAFVQFWYDIR